MKIVYAWRCGCSKTSTAINYVNEKLKKSNNKVIYACPTIQTEKEVKNRLNKGLLINSKTKDNEELTSKLLKKSGISGWNIIEQRNELLRTEKCLIVTHVRLMYTDPLEFYDGKFIKGSKDLIIDEFAMKLKKFYIQRPTLLAYIVHPHYSMPEYVTYENEFDINHKRKENYWLEWEEDMIDNEYKKLHKIKISENLLEKELNEMFPLWLKEFKKLCNWSEVFKIYQRLSLNFRRTYITKNENKIDETDYSRWLWLTPKELKENGLDLDELLGSTFSILDSNNFIYEGQLYSKLKRIYKLFNYQKTISYYMLLIAKQIVTDQYFDTDINDIHPGYYVGGINPLERWFIQNIFNVICLDGSAIIFKDIYKHYGFTIKNDKKRSIKYYADNLQCHMFNFKSFSQTSIQKLTQFELKRIILEYINPYVDFAKYWYVILPSKCNDTIIKVFQNIYGRKSVCDCSTKNRTYYDEKGVEKQISIKNTLESNKNAKFIFVNYEGQIGSNEFLKCDGIIALSQLNLPRNINKIYSSYYGIDNYNDLYTTHLIYQESARSKARLQEPITYKMGHKIPFIGLFGMSSNQYVTFNRLNTNYKIFDSNEELNKKRLIL